MESEFCLCFDGRLRKELSESAKTYLLNPVRIRKPWSVIAARRKLAQLFREEVFDVVICHSAWCQSIFGPVITKAGIPLVFSLHDSTDGRHWLERFASRVKPKLILSNSFFTTATAHRVYPGIPAKVIYWPVSPSIPISESERVSLRCELGVNDGEAVIIQVSRMERWKGHLLHLEALSKLRHKSDWVCWMVGGFQRPHERKYFASIQRRAAELGLSERIRFLGQRTDVPKLLAAADIHCQPNIAPEPFGRTFIEALLAGLPLVTTKMGAALEIVNSSCGVLVDPGNASELADALSGLIENRGRRKQQARQCIARAKALCDPKTQLRVFAEALAGILANSEPN